MSDNKSGDQATPDEVDAELADLLGEREEMVDVVLGVPNGMTRADGAPLLVVRRYTTTTTALMVAQAALENGVVLDVADARRRAGARIAALLGDDDLADEIAAALAEAGLLSDGLGR